eukprot:TRINITY_DN4086_c0_g1_i4.p1 TRINITY_DN4086_c0_g1~~TRINITY_DN4086_c0_g1_i4.p1  ORF type:complete len:1493 (-),score=493.27 TRINITY_DN4086_c0_g1_i4:12-4490(-)
MADTTTSIDPMGVGYTDKVLLPKKRVSPEQKANWFSIITFWWINSTIFTAYKRILQPGDLWEAHHEDQSQLIHEKFDRCWSEELKREHPSATRALIRGFGVYYGIGLIAFGIYAGCQLVGPHLLRLIVIWFTNRLYNIPQDPNIGYYYAMALFLVAMLGSFCFFQANYISARTGAHLRAVIVLAVYRKTTRLSVGARAGVSQGQIVNLMSNDSQRLLETFLMLNNGIFAPFQIIVALALLYQVVGVYTFVGLGVMLFSFPFNGVIGKRMTAIRRDMVVWSDKRVKITNEILQAIKIIKLYAWEDSFLKTLNTVREGELQNLKRFNIARSQMIFFITVTPTLVAILVFISYAKSGNLLSPDRVFSAVALLNIIRTPLAFLPLLFALLAQVKVTIERFEKFMLEKESPNARLPLLEGQGPSVHINHSDFTWGAPPPKQDSIQSQPQGPGAPKVKLTKEQRKAANQEKKQKTAQEKRERKEARAAKRAAAAQAKANKKGKAVASAGAVPEVVIVEAAPPPLCLQDIDLHFSGSPLVMVVGAVGSGKSSLCMALLSELERVRGDVEVRGTMAYGAQKEWIINATLRDNILFGSPYNEMRYQQVIDVCALRKDLEMFPAGDMIEIGERGINLSGGQKQRVSLARAVYSGADICVFDDPLSAVDAHVGKHLFHRCIREFLRDKLVVLSTNQLQYLPYADRILFMKEGRIVDQGTYTEMLAQNKDFADLMASFGGQDNSEEESSDVVLEGASVVEQEGKKDAEEALPLVKSPNMSKDGNLVKQEERDSGEVTWSLYFQFCAAGGVFLFVAFISIFIVETAARTGTDWWLSYWSSNGFLPNAQPIDFYIGIYVAFGAATAMMVIVRSWTYVMFNYYLSKNLHLDLLVSILRSPMSFFDTTPLGRIINRFTRDLDGVDQLLPQTFQMFLFSAFGTIAIIVVAATIVPWLLVAFGPLVIIYYFISKFYKNTSRELQRMESISRSPIFAHYGETLNGVSSIRAYHCEERYIVENEVRMEENTKTFMALQASNQWLGLRLDFLGNILVFLTAILLLVTDVGSNSALVGLALSYILSLTGLLNRSSLGAADTETKMNAVERIKEYSNRPSEAPTITDVRPPANWPSQGHIKIDDLVMSYRPGLDPVLKGVTCEIRPHEKVGIVGRTGAGKSSVLLALFRLVEKTSGMIVVDGIDIATLGLNDLRKNLSIIPQDPVLFSGTIRSNLDPFEEHPVEEIWQVLEQVQLRSVVEGFGGVEATVSEGGENWSVGQRQLICLGRALLRHPKILVLDEATASVDVVTDSLIQRTLRTQFADATIITIAHRLNTIMDSDRIIVMSDGRVEEFDSPANLLRDPNGFLSFLVEETGPANAAFLKAIASGTASVLDAPGDRRTVNLDVPVPGGPITSPQMREEAQPDPFSVLPDPASRVGPVERPAGTAASALHMDAIDVPTILTENAARAQAIEVVDAESSAVSSTSDLSSSSESDSDDDDDQPTQDMPQPGVQQ